jgi:hypothetical protein
MNQFAANLRGHVEESAARDAEVLHRRIRVE